MNMKINNSKSKNKKGYILATCFAVMIVVMALCTFILSQISYGAALNRLNAVEFERRAYIDMIGEDFASDGAVDEETHAFSLKATIEGSVSDTRTLTVRSGETLLLTVIRTTTGKITLWKYGG